MAEMLNQPKPDLSDDPMNWMGKPVSQAVRNEAYQHALAMGLKPVEARWVVGKMSESLERDQPYEAQRAACVYLDLTGSYRMLAAILSGVCAEARGAA